MRILAILPCALAFGCANTWDAMTAKKWREDPWHRTFGSDDPMTVLRNKVEGDERAAAMRRLEEPAEHGRPAAEQEEALQILGNSAVNEPSPVVRTAAIDALGRFKDPRCVRLLIAAYTNADGQATKKGENPAEGLQPVSSLSKESLEALGVDPSAGFSPLFASTIRVRAVTALAATGQAEAATYLGEIARRKAETPDDEAARDIRLAALRGLGTMRKKESVRALADVLAAEKGHDIAVVARAHEGLVNLTGKELPADPEQWNKVVQAGVELAPEPNMLQRAIHFE